MLEAYNGFGTYYFSGRYKNGTFMPNTFQDLRYVKPIRIINVQPINGFRYEEYLIHWELETGELLEFTYVRAKDDLENYLHTNAYWKDETGKIIHQFEPYGEILNHLKWLEKCLDETVVKYRAGLLDKTKPLSIEHLEVNVHKTHPNESRTIPNAFGEYAKFYLEACEHYNTHKPNGQQLNDLSEKSKGTWSQKLKDVYFLALLLKELEKKIHQAKTQDREEFWIHAKHIVDDLLEKKRHRKGL